MVVEFLEVFVDRLLVCFEKHLKPFVCEWSNLEPSQRVQLAVSRLDVCQTHSCCAERRRPNKKKEREARK